MVWAKLGILIVLAAAGCGFHQFLEPPEVGQQPVAETPAAPKTPEDPKAPRSGTKRILLIGLDGVGFSQFKKMQAGGHFRNFKPVAPMVSSFPSISDPNWAKIIQAPVEVSFTKEHFDQSLQSGKGEISGSLIDHVFSPPLYESYFDFRPEGALQHLASMTYSEISGLYWLDTLEKRLNEAPADKVLFSALFANTDFIAHTKGEQAIFRYLKELDKRIDALKKRYQEKNSRVLEVVLVSDHGNIFLKPKAVDVEGVLKEDNWNSATTLEKDRDVVYVVPEILSFAPFYVAKGQESALARTVSRAVGVHVSFFLSGPKQVDFFARGGKDHSRATFEAEGRQVRYKVLSGSDPFGQENLFKNGPLGVNRYFQESLRSEYPNALVRAFEGLTANSKQSPSVLVSSKSGYVFSNPKLELITKVMGLESVHGSLHREESLGIFVSTDRELPPAPPQAVLDLLK